MKKIIGFTLISLLMTLWGCSDSSNDDPVDPIKEFRTFSADLRDLVYHEYIAAGRIYTALPASTPASDPEKISDHSITEDLYIQFRYVTYFCNTVIEFETDSMDGNTFSNAEDDASITLADGNYILECVYYMFLTDSMERIDVTFTWNPGTSRWLITGERTNVTGGTEPQPWLRCEGQINGTTSSYNAMAFFIEEEEGETDAMRHLTNVLYAPGASIPLQAAAEREACDSDCVDLDSTDLYDQGVTALGLASWNDFKNYGIMAPPPEYEMPYPEDE